MSDQTHIQWTDATWNVFGGCSKVSAGCANCYAVGQAHRMAGNPNARIRDRYAGLTRITAAGAVQWSGQLRLHEDMLPRPLSWRKPRRIFVNSLSDTFHEDVPDEWIDRVLGIIVRTPQHTYQLLTKRPDRMAAYFARLDTPRGHHEACFSGDPHNRNWELHGAIVRLRNGQPLPNVWLGTSVEDQRAAETRIPHLLRCPAAVRFLSVEPLLGPVDLDSVWPGGLPCPGPDIYVPSLHLVIAGGESGHNARPCHISWLRDLRDQCRTAGVPFFLKQLGSQPRSLPTDCGDGSGRQLTDRKGGDMREWPADLRVREMPSESCVAAVAAGKGA